MQRYLQRFNRKSIFFKLFSSFMVVILLFISFTLLSFSYFKRAIQQEIIVYNTNNLIRTTKDFEHHFNKAYNSMTRFYLQDDLKALSNEDLDYAAANQIIKDLFNLQTDDSLYFDNLLLWDRNHNMVFGQDRGASPNKVFADFYSSDAYPYEFWKTQFKDLNGTKFYQTATFTKDDPVFRKSKNVMPIVVKNKLMPDIIMIGFLDIDRMIDDFHQSINHHFLILDDEGVPLFTSSSIQDGSIPSLPADKDWVKTDKNYYFYSKGLEHEFTYVNVIPAANILSHISKMNITLTIILFVTLLIAISVSYFFTKKFNNPVRRIFELMKPSNESSLSLKHINEFELIQEHVQLLLEANKEIHEDLTEKRTLLRYYAYINMMKKMHADFQELKELEEKKQPYRIVLIQPTFKERFFKEKLDEDKTIQHLMEYVKIMMTNAFQKSVYTFQIERNEILSIIYFYEHENRLSEILETIQQAAQGDKDYYFLTMTVSSLHTQAAELTTAYEKVQEVSKYRPFYSETTLCYETGQLPKDYSPSPSYRKQLHTHLMEGNAEEVTRLLDQMIEKMEKKAAPTVSYMMFKEAVFQETIQIIQSLHLHADALRAKEDSFIYSVQKLKDYFHQLIHEACDQIKQSKNEQHDVIASVKNYIQINYASELTLDTVAKQMNISGGYLSTYFKEKTAINFLDYVNQVRIEKAMIHLVETDWRINEIARKVGYQNLNSFNRMFKKHTGLTPSQYRKTRSHTENEIS
ncbi:helix-turn-helix domain-containing protein [Bacillus sp. SD088]|uniref:helix-turn-helix domain-containing protein n=1 Tax=Bacillus sp. SD088 TaxID=2782012 RepID=UPI001A970910|nr:helix-turn-helix domain-containing protein [Bacillus sp. SD088]MBO0991650.1 AraC family transcriptional regulator [Bacillus sp. SD088]